MARITILKTGTEIMWYSHYLWVGYRSTKEDYLTWCTTPCSCWSALLLGTRGSAGSALPSRLYQPRWSVDEWFCSFLELVI